jgi:DNA-binding transcriptional MerR regulator
VPVRTIRFYEDEGIIPPPARTEAGYRLYTPNDIRRLRLARRARLLGLPLAEVKTLVEQAFDSQCSDFTEQLLARIVHQRAEIDRRIAELQALREEMDGLEQHVRHARQAAAGSGRRVATCGFCPVIDDEGDCCEPHTGTARNARL